MGEWIDIYECENESTKLTGKCTIEYTVGTEKATGSETSTENSSEVSIETSVGFELEGVFSSSLTVGTSTGFNWGSSHSKSTAFSESRTQSVEISMPPQTKVVVKQVIGFCGNYRVYTHKWKLAEPDEN